MGGGRAGFPSLASTPLTILVHVSVRFLRLPLTIWVHFMGFPSLFGCISWASPHYLDHFTAVRFLRLPLTILVHAYALVCFGTFWYGLVRFGTLWYGVVRFGTVW